MSKRRKEMDRMIRHMSTRCDAILNRTQRAPTEDVTKHVTLAYPFASLIPPICLLIQPSHWKQQMFALQRLAAVEPEVVQEVSARQTRFYF